MMRVRDGDGGGEVTAPPQHLVFAYYLTGHGFKHATQVVRQLLAAEHEVHIVTAVPEFGVTTEITSIGTSPRLHVRRVEQDVLDCVALVPDTLMLDKAVVSRASILKGEVEWLKSINCDTVMLTPWNPSQVPDVSDATGMKMGTALDSDCESPQIVRGREETPSPRPPSKRRRGRSLPPASPPALAGRQRRSNSSPPSPDRAKSNDEAMASAEVLLTPVVVLWDIENCKVPKDALVEHIAENIRDALRMIPAVDSVAAKIQSYGKVAASIRKGLENTGVKHVGTLNRRKDTADKHILTDMFLFALDNPAPAAILLISGDADFAPAVRKLVDRGYTIVVAVPPQGTAAADLLSSGTHVWDWPSLARGKGIVIRRSGTADLNVLKSQMIDLFKANGGHIQLDFNTIYSEYTKLYRKQIKLTDYNVGKVVDLFEKLGKPFTVIDRKKVFWEMQSDQATTSSTAGSSELPTLVVAEDLFVNPEEDWYGLKPLEDLAVEDVVTGAGSSLEDEPKKGSKD